MAKEVKKEEIIVIKEDEITTKAGTKFNPYKAVDASGKLVDCRFKQEVDLKIFANGKKFKVSAIKSDASKRYEFPRWYLSDVEIIEVIY